ncbi:PAS domain S-box protein [Pelatocladus sp. BLCC-F211]|uniref:PAS domain S-box protein n=1 Tax=Pelatocladus sp. BLCC-F211 TaxID=3342752 RepID=UPI0035B94ACF
MITFLSHLIVEAEKARVLGQVIAAEEYYEQAIDAAKANAYLEEEALAYELAAKYYLERGRSRFAQNYMQEAHYAYTRLDATAKVKELETKYPQLLFELPSANNNTSKRSTSPKVSSSSSVEALKLLEAVTRANIAISSEINLEQLLRVLIKILIENTDAQTGYLILSSPTNLENGEEWKIVASGIIDTEASEDTLGKPVLKISVQSLPIDDHLPKSVINDVIHTLENVIVDDASCEDKFIHDPYIQQHRTKSILCVPLLNQGKLIGIVYLENNLTNGVFTNKQLDILQLLFAQAAISISHAKIYSQLRRRKKQLRAREKRVNQILDAIPIGVTAHDPTGKFIYSNLKARELLGIPAPIEITIEQLSEVFQVYQAGTDQLYPIEQLPIVRTFAGESVKIDDMELRQADRNIPLEVLTVPIFDETGAIIYAIAAFRDITERKQTQKLLADYNHTLETQIAERTKKLQQQNEILQALFDHIPVMLKLRDQADQTLVINREYERVLGWTLDEMRDVEWLTKCYPDTEQRQQVREHIQAATGKWQDFRTRCKNGRYIDTTWANIRLSTGQIIGIGQDISDRKQLEKALQASQAKLNDILNSAGASIASFRVYPDRSWENEYHSLGCETVFGYTPQELTHELWLSRVSSEDLTAITEHAFTAIAQEQAITFEYRFAHKNCSLRWIAHTLTSRWDQAGCCWIVTMVGVDITARKQAEMALRESEERFREIAENINQIFFVWSANSEQFLYVSPGYEKIYGLSCESLYQNPKSWLNLVHPDDLQSVWQSLNQQSQGQPARREYRIIKSDGTIRWMFAEVFPIFDPAGNLLRYIGLTEDITERKRIEDALRQRKQEFRTLVENAPDVISRIDRDYRFRYINPRVETETGIAAAQWIGKTELEMGFPETIVNPWHAILNRVFETGEEQIYETEFPSPEGKQYWFCRLVPELAEDGSVETVLSIGRNITERKHTEEALRESEQFLRSIYEGTAAAIFIVDVLEDGSFRYVDINPAHEWMSGLLPSEIAGKTPEQIFPPEDAQVISARFVACTTTRKRITYEERLLIKGKETWWINVLTPIHRENGQIYRLIGSCFNITRRKKLEHSLRSQADQERLLITITQHIRQSLDLEQILATTVVEVQRTLQADRALIFQLNQDGSGQVIKEAVVPEYPVTEQMRWRDEPLPDYCYDFYRQGNPRIVPDVAIYDWVACLSEFLQQVNVKSKVVAPIVQTLEDSSIRVWGLLIVHACSDYRQWQASEAEFLQQISNQLAIALHQANLYQQLQTELAERKQAEEYLRESEERFRKAFDAAPIGVALVSPQGQFLMVNHSLCEIVGYTKAEILNLTMREITHPDDLEADLELMQKLLANEIRVYQVEKRYLHNRGDTIHTLLNVSLVKDQHRRPLYFIAQIQDISDRYEVDRIKNEFISIVSHELRTPLTAIRGSLGILETGVFDHEPEQAKEMLQIAFNNSDRLVRLVNDILDLERLESGKIQLVMETCEIANLVQQAIETVQAIANEVGVKISVMVPNVQISAAADSIIQTLINLLSNAIKFSPAGSTVCLSAELLSPEEDAGMGGQGGQGGQGGHGGHGGHGDTGNFDQLLSASPRLPLPASSSHTPQSPKILFKVRDHGRGIPPEKLESIFGRFQQVDVSDRRQKRGTGLGLAICKNIVQQHGGRIWVESVLGEGSTFYFTLPITREEA